MVAGSCAANNSLCMCVPFPPLIVVWTLKPHQVSWEEAAALPTSGMTALQALRFGRAVEAGQRVLINGASSGESGPLRCSLPSQWVLMSRACVQRRTSIWFAH